MPKLGTAYVDVRAKRNRLKPDLDSAHGVVKATAAKIQKTLDAVTFGAIAISAAAMATQVARSIGQSIGDASDLQEVTSKFGVVFAGQEQKAEQWAQTMVDSYAMSTREARQYLASIQDLLVPMGMNSAAAAEMSNNVVKLAADLGSFNNVGTDKVIDDIQSALVGNYETMKKYGVVLNAASVQHAALAANVDKTKDQLTAADKAAAAYQIILSSSSAAVGDMARTSDGYANTTKRLAAAWENFSATLGEKFLKSATQVKGVTADILTNLTKAIQGPPIDQQIAATQAAIDKLRAEYEAKNASRADKRAAREQRHQEMVARYVKSNTGLTETESAKVKKAFDEINRAQLKQMSEMSSYELNLQYYQQRMDYLKDIQKLEQLSRKKETAPVGMDQTAKDNAAIDAALEQAFAGVGDFYEKWKGLRDQVLEEAGGPLGMIPTQKDIAEQSEYLDWQFEIYDEQQQKLQALEYESSVNRFSIQRTLMDAFISEEGRKNEAIGRMQAKAAMDAVNNAENALQYFAQQNKTAFEAYKIYKISEATISGIDSAVKAWNAGMSTGGPWAPAVAAAYATASLAWTGAQISMIESMSYGGGSKSSSGGSSASVSSFATTAGQSESAQLPGDGETESGRGNYYIYVDGAVENREYMIFLAGQLSELVQDYEVRLVASESRKAERLG